MSRILESKYLIDGGFEKLGGVSDEPAARPKFDYETFRVDVRKRITPDCTWTRLAKKCGVTKSKLQDAIMGNTKPTLEMTLSLCKCLKIDVWGYFR